MEYEIVYRNVSNINPLKVVLSVKNSESTLFVDQVDLTKEGKRTEYIIKLVERCPGLESERSNIEQKLLEIIDGLLVTNDTQSNEHTPIAPLELSEQALNETDPELVGAAENFLKKPKLIDTILKHIEILGLVGEKALAIALYLVCTSRLLQKPLAASILGISSAGKSFAAKLIGQLLPEETVFRAHRITPTALSYLPSGSLIHRAVIAGERSRKQDDDQAEATRALREMISDGSLRIAVTGKDENGNLATNYVEQQGPISYVESTTLGLSEIFDEDRTRYIFLCCDESKTQSERIMRRLAEDCIRPIQKEQIESIYALHHTAQRLLKSYTVIVPFADHLATCLPANKPECRRAFGHLLGLIKAVALLHQYQREKTANGQIVASLDDYEIVRKYLTDPIARGLGVELTVGAQALLDVIEDQYEAGDTFTSHDLKEITGIGKAVYDRLRELRQYGFIRIDQPAQGSAGAKYVLNLYPSAPPGLDLPDLNNINNKVSSETGDAND